MPVHCAAIQKLAAAGKTAFNGCCDQEHNFGSGRPCSTAHGTPCGPGVVIADMRRRVERQFGMDIFARLATETMLAGQTLPGLIIHDSSDREVPSDHAKRLHRAWPASRLLLVDGLGHQRLLRDPEVVAAAVAFLADADAAGGIRQAAATAAIMQPREQPTR